jgi:hypothetical protein
MNITSAQYITNPMSGETACINAVIDGIAMSVPLDPANRHYAEIMRQVDAGDLVIQEAEGNEPLPADETPE